MSRASSFEATLWQADERGAKAFITLPFDVKADYGRARCPVLVTICGYTWRTAVQPFAHGFHISVSRRVRDIADIDVGDCVTVDVMKDEEPPDVEVPVELAQRLRGDARARRAFDALAPSHRREYANWVGEAKWPETRVRRAAKAADLLKSDEGRR